MCVFLHACVCTCMCVWYVYVCMYVCMYVCVFRCPQKMEESMGVLRADIMWSWEPPDVDLEYQM